MPGELATQVTDVAPGAGWNGDRKGSGFPGFPGHGKSIIESSKAFSLRDAVENGLFLSGRDIWMVRFDQAKSGIVRGPKRFKNALSISQFHGEMTP